MTREELARLDPERIVVVGGPAAVSEQVADQLAQYGGEGFRGVERILGPESERYVCTGTGTIEFRRHPDYL